MNSNDNLHTSTMESLQSMLLENHRYSREFKHAYEVLKDYPDTLDAEIKLRVMPGHDQRRYNLPTSDEVAVILPGDGTAPERRDIILRPRFDWYSLSRIHDGHPAYSPLHYVLLFPHGEHGWHCDLYHRPVPGSIPSPNWNGGTPPALAKHSTLPFAYIHAIQNILLFFGGVAYFNNISWICGHPLIRHA
jgi:hypothetical protein